MSVYTFIWKSKKIWINTLTMLKLSVIRSRSFNRMYILEHSEGLFTTALPHVILTETLSRLYERLLSNKLRQNAYGHAEDVSMWLPKCERWAISRYKIRVLHSCHWKWRVETRQLVLNTVERFNGLVFFMRPHERLYACVVYHQCPMESLISTMQGQVFWETPKQFNVIPCRLDM